MKETKKSILEGAPVNPALPQKIVASNTVEYHAIDGSRRIRFHHTDILIFKNQCVSYDSGGWRTMTTKERMTRFGPCLVQSERGFWYVVNAGKKYAYRDKMAIDLKTGETDTPPYESAFSAFQKKRKKINDYIKTYAEKLFSGTMEKPGPGDCFMCMIAAQSSEYKGPDHLIAHVDETYLVPALALAAIKGCPEYAPPLVRHDIVQLLTGRKSECFFRDNKPIARLLRHYFFKQGVYNHD